MVDGYIFVQNTQTVGFCGTLNDDKKFCCIFMAKRLKIDKLNSHFSRSFSFGLKNHLDISVNFPAIAYYESPAFEVGLPLLAPFVFYGVSSAGVGKTSFYL